MLDHNFSGTPFTLGIEEELMICDAETLELAQAIDVIVGDLPDDLPGEVKPELMQSVLEVATRPCADITEAAEQLASSAAASGRSQPATGLRSARRAPTPRRTTRTS